MPLKQMNEDNIEIIEKCIKKVQKCFPSISGIPLKYGEQILYHYTSFEKLFNILNGDSLWASRSRFSNDFTEDKILGDDWLKKEQYYGDNYILCFSNEDDVLSQWRGYCPQGGATIGFRFPSGYSTFTLLDSNFDETSKLTGENIELYKNRPLPVIYCKPKEKQVPGIDVNESLFAIFEDLEINDTKVRLYDIVPYLKNAFFYEEKELRLVFNNSDRALEKCIRFRTLSDGTMIPYIIVKFGDSLKMGRDLSITYTTNYINNIFEKKIKNRNNSPIIIPCGRNQSEICNSFVKKIREYKKEIYMDSRKKVEQNWVDKYPLQIICDGHLPIISITVSPCPQQNYIKEVIERFCQSHYWLQTVQVKCSNIPYIAPKL